MRPAVNHLPGWIRQLLQTLGDAAIQSRRGRRNRLLRRMRSQSFRSH